MNSLALVAPSVATEPDLSLDALAERANEAYQRELEHARAFLVAAIEVGDWLLEAKKRVPADHWHRWINEHCMFSITTAQKRSRLAQHKDLILPHLDSLTSVHRALMYVRGLPATDGRRHSEGGKTAAYSDDVRDEALRLNALGDLNTREIGRMLGISHGTIWKWLHPDTLDPRAEAARRRQRRREEAAAKRRREMERGARSAGGAIGKAYASYRTMMQALQSALDEATAPENKAALRSALEHGNRLEDDLGRAIRGAYLQRESA